MFRNLKNSKLGRYYSSVLAKYGKIVPFALALALFMIIFTADSFDIMDLVNFESKTSLIISIVFLSLCALMAIYFCFSKLSNKNINSLDFIVFVWDLELVLMVVELIALKCTVQFIAIFVVALVLGIALTVIRVAIAKPETYEIAPSVRPNASLKSYLAAFVRRYNVAALVVAGLAVFAALYLFDGAMPKGDANWPLLAAVTLVLIVATVVLSIPSRIVSKRMGEVDACIAFALVATVLYAIPMFMNFAAIKLVIWLVALFVLVAFAVLIIKNTYIVEPVAERVIYGQKGLKVYFGLLAHRYNLVLGAIIGIIAFVVMYCLITIDVLFGVETVVAGGFYLILDLVVLGFFATLLLSSRKRSIGACDIIGFAVDVFAVLAVIPTIQFFSVLKLIGWILLLLIMVVFTAIRVASVMDPELKPGAKKVA